MSASLPLSVPGKGGETREKERERLAPADAHLPRDKRENQSVRGVTITPLLFSPHLFFSLVWQI